jgi:hypothetical protein
MKQQDLHLCKQVRSKSCALKNLRFLTKESVVLLIILFAICIPLVHSQNVTTLTPDQLKLAGNVSNIAGNANDALEKEVHIPETLQIFARILFGLNESEGVSFQLFIILIASWVILYLLLVSFLELVPLFEGALRWISGIVLMLLLGVSKGLKSAAEFLIWLSSFGGTLKNWEIFGLGILLIFLVVLYFALAKFSKFIKSKSDLAHRRRLGQDIGVMGEKAKWERNYS